MIFIQYTKGGNGMNKSDICKRADDLFNCEKGRNCSQTTLLVMAEYFDIDDERLADIAAPFGGGLCSTHGSVCGAISGALMLIGLKADDKNAIGQELLNYINEKYGTLMCNEILDIDFSDEEQVKAEKGPKKLSICTPFIVDICGWLADRLG